MAGERERAELRHVREGFWLHEGSADVSGKLLPGLVGKSRGLFGWEAPGRLGSRPDSQTLPQRTKSVCRGGRRYAWNVFLGDISARVGVKTSTALQTGRNEAREGAGLRLLGKPDRGKQAYLPIVWVKLGTSGPRLLQCIRDPSQPSSAVELANLAAHADQDEGIA